MWGVSDRGRFFLRDQKQCVKCMTLTLFSYEFLMRVVSGEGGGGEKAWA